MNKFQHHFVVTLIVGLFSLAGISFLAIKETTQAAVPNEYIANYEIKESWEKVLGIFVEIDAYTKLGNNIHPDKFKELNSSFTNLFPKLPQDYAFKVTYQQCNLLSSQLGNISQNDPMYRSLFSSFMSNCYKPFTDVLKKINSQYTTSPKATASPKTGPAPLAITFDGRGSIDPSNETIPSRNFFWYYRDINGIDQIIGNGPVLTYTFEKEGNYIVHLTVRSSNKQKGILDGDQTVSIDVTPKSAIPSVHANGQKMDKNIKVKIGTMEAEKGIVFDATSTIAMGGRQIIAHRWEITSRDGFKYARDGDGKPELIRVSLPGKGEYKVTLTVFDNENNKTTETFDLVSSDPVAIIKQIPEKGNTSTAFGFDAGTSYSVVSSIKLYTWEIFDQNGNKLETYQGKDIKQQFKNPGFYTIKLTVEDSLGQTNIDTVQVYVESTEPIPQFTVNPSNERLHPSKFLFDATISSDMDKTNGVDSLEYQWFFPETAKVNIVSTEEKNGKIIAEFNSIGKFKYKLMVKDQYGKMSELEKEIEIKSILRPEIVATPIAMTRGNSMNFTVKTNQPILSYEWDFGDNDKRTIQSDTIFHLYKKTGIYNVRLKVNGENETYNEITKTVFVGEKDYPIAGFEVFDKSNIILTQNEICREGDPISGFVEHPAYQIDRYQEVLIDPKLSVNTKGEKSDLEFFFQPRNKEIYKNTTFLYKFDELGCNYIDLTAEDTSIGKNNTARIWFRVVNSLPKLDNIILFFPQYGNQMGVGFNETQVRDIFNSPFDPLIVKVSATNTVDPDGFISYYKWYYYLKDDPTRFIETKITPGDIPYAFFSMPKIPGEYSFGVMMYDNDEGKISSQEIIGNGPIVFFPPDSSRPDVPLVTLRMSSSAVEVGDEVTFEVISKVISDRPDFVKERTIYYDFDGDGTWDLVTKKDRVTYAYTKPSEVSGFRPRASVLYRGYRGVSQGGTIIVRNGLKPRLLFANDGNFAIFRDVSLGDISQKRICPDVKTCTDLNAVKTGSAFSYIYPAPGRYFASIDLSDEHANEAKKRLVINVETGATTKDYQFLSIPEATITTGGIELFVGNSLENTILFYIKHNENLGPCYIDTDVSEDSNGNGNPLDDADFQCNMLYQQKYEPQYDSIVGRLYYSDRNKKLVSKDFMVGFIDFEVALSPENKKVYDQISLLLKELNGPERFTGTNRTFKDMLKSTRDNLSDTQSTLSNVVSLKDYIGRNTIKLNEQQDDMLKKIFLELSNRSTAAAEGLGEYGIAKQDILSILPTNLAIDIDGLFKEFENVEGDASLNISQQDKRKEVLQKIVNVISKSVAPEGQTPTTTQIDKTDMDEIVVSNICKIMSLYSIPSDLCNTTDIRAVPDDIPVEQGEQSTNRLKIIFIVLGIIVFGFIGLVVVFAVKAKLKQEKEEQEGGGTST
ncbi:MAG: PKD domain-containing protein [Candidatus Absconditabacteria bacterium]|nr:PKD domain-containing protein [Candidatus Absconditabacteria bacterium]